MRLLSLNLTYRTVVSERALLSTCFGSLTVNTLGSAYARSMKVAMTLCSRKRHSRRRQTEWYDTVHFKR
jgi:hypothetical protein